MTMAGQRPKPPFVTWSEEGQRTGDVVCLLPPSLLLPRTRRTCSILMGAEKRATRLPIGDISITDAQAFGEDNMLLKKINTNEIQFNINVKIFCKITLMSK